MRLPTDADLDWIGRFRCALALRIDPFCAFVTEELGKPDFETLTSDLIPLLAACRWHERNARRFVSLNAGQTCLAPRRAIVHARVCDSSVRALQERTRTQRPLTRVCSGTESLQQLVLEAEKVGARLIGLAGDSCRLSARVWPRDGAALRPGARSDPRGDGRARHARCDTGTRRRSMAFTRWWYGR